MDVILHLGVHRTATTALQNLLAAASGRLAEGGIRYLGPQRMRAAGLAAHVTRRERGDGDARALDAARAALAPHWQPAARQILISEENLIGAMLHNYRLGHLYPAAEARLAALRALLPAPPAAVFVTIRDFAGYWPSVHAHLALRRRVAAGFEAERLAASRGNSWLPLLRATRAVFPEARLGVWRYRDLPGLVPGLAAALTGLEDLAAAGAAPAARANASLGAATLRRLARVADPAERRRLIRAARSAPRTAARTPFPAEAAARLGAAFEAEWQAIAGGAVAGAEAVDPAHLQEAG